MPEIPNRDLEFCMLFFDLIGDGFLEILHVSVESVGF